MSALLLLERLRAQFGGRSASDKLALLGRLADAPLGSAKALLRLHETLLFLRAFPDDRGVLEQVEGMLARFHERRDLRRFARELENSGVAGSEIRFSFFGPTATWLARRFPEHLKIDWPEFELRDRLESRLELLVTYSETPAIDEGDLSLREWIDRLKGPRETDGSFLVRRFDALDASRAVRTHLFEEMDVPFVLSPGPGTPARTTSRRSNARTVFQTAPLPRDRPDLAREVLRPPRSIRAVSTAEGAELADLAREAMVTRSRDLDAFMHADPRDARIVDCGDGLEFACLGVNPERRLLLEAVYGFLTLQNGVPTGYVLASAFMRSCEIAFNVFETFRGGPSARVYGRVLAMCRALFGADTFTIYPYQLGHENEEGLRSGAWWFYEKLGFRPREASARRVYRRELAAIRRDPKHRSSLTALKKLAAHNLYWSLGAPRDDVIGSFPLDRIGFAASDYLSQRFGSDRERGERACADEAGRILGVPRWRALPPGERLAFQRWAPVVRVLPGVESWSRVDRAALGRVVRAKGGLRESEFVLQFDGHRRLRKAFVELARLPKR
ncbi:MAG: hypothetical protein ACKVXR_13190 [Planctomycetota bacterium]